MAHVFKSLDDPKLVETLRDGAIGIIPTDTVYGIVCKATEVESVNRLYALKNSINKLGTIIAADINQLVELGIKARYVKAVEQFWPGPVSVVIPFSDPRGQYLRLGRFDVAVRLPDNKKLATVLKKSGALLTTSANLPDKPVANTLADAQNFFGDKVDFYVDGGDLSDRKPSTIVKVIDDAVEVLREGAVKIEDNGIAK